MLIGHQKQWKILKQSAQLGKLSHAYLFWGEEKLGKKTLAIEFTKWLFGQNLLNPPHLDFVLVEPEKKEIQISQIRDLSWKLALKPFSAPLKVAIIDQAHLMNQEAQSCFLKTLEEPKGKALLILITEHPEMLFSTILSRVQKIKFYPVKKAEIESYLKSQATLIFCKKNKISISEKKIKEIARISLGKPGIAIDFARMSDKLENQQKIIKDLISLVSSDLAFRFQYVKDLSKEPKLVEETIISSPPFASARIKETLNIWLLYLRGVLLEKCLTPGVKFPCCSITKLKNILKQIQSINFLISNTNVSPKLALEILMLEMDCDPSTIFQSKSAYPKI